jgi:L-amino acid N-acyltransferase YncA/DNA-binding transcriptional ArsR family regulator
MKIEGDSARTYARWFQALADPTRVMICNLLANAGRAMPVGEIVEAVDIGQSTVSHHLKLLAEVGFVEATPQGTARLYRFNRRCLEAFPTAAELVMGRLPRTRGVQSVAGIQVGEPRQSGGGGISAHPAPDPDRIAVGELADVRIEPLLPGDWPVVAAIYAEGIATGNATFETAPPSWERWDQSHLPDHRLVARTGPDDGVVAWSALAPVSDRCVYGGIAENSIYVTERARGQGVGRRLLTALVERAEQAGIWTVQTGIFPDNGPSLELHRRCGFRVVGVRERLGQLHGRWRDVLLLERRSTRAGR